LLGNSTFTYWSGEISFSSLIWAFWNIDLSNLTHFVCREEATPLHYQKFNKEVLLELVLFKN